MNTALSQSRIQDNQPTNQPTNSDATRCTRPGMGCCPCDLLKDVTELAFSGGSASEDATVAHATTTTTTRRMSLNRPADLAPQRLAPSPPSAGLLCLFFREGRSSRRWRMEARLTSAQRTCNSRIATRSCWRHIITETGTKS
jgi:hypothetical protein